MRPTAPLHVCVSLNDVGLPKSLPVGIIVYLEESMKMCKLLYSRVTYAFVLAYEKFVRSESHSTASTQIPS